MTMTTETPTRPRRRNAGVAKGTETPPDRDSERRLKRIAKRIAENDALYPERDALIVEMYDYGYTHKQIADLINAASGGDLTYDAVGRIIRLARADGAEV